MKVQAISFGNKKQIPANHEEMQNRVLQELYRRWNEGERFEYAKVDYYREKEPIITLYHQKNKPKLGLIKNLFKKITKFFK